MRNQPSVLHLDLDAFFASVEQRDKPSLRGKPVVVGGLGPRGVVSTASYEARQFGVRSAMRTSEARARCPHAAYLTGRFDAYRETSRAVLRVLHEITDVIEPLSLDEAFVDLDAGTGPSPDTAEVRRIATELKRRVHEVTGGLTASVGAGTSKLIAKIASDLDKPDGLTVVPPGTELAFLHPMAVTVIPGVGPATNERLRRVGIRTVADLDRFGEDELVAMLGQAHGRSLARMARAQDDRAVEYVRESKSISVEDTFDQDIADPVRLDLLVRRMSERVAQRLTASGTSGRTVTVKIRLFDFSTHTRSATLPGPTDDLGTITRLARRLLSEVETSAGVRLLGVGVSGLADWVQDDLFSTRSSEPFTAEPTAEPTVETAAGADTAVADPPASVARSAEVGSASAPAGATPDQTLPDQALPDQALSDEAWTDGAPTGKPVPEPAEEPLGEPRAPRPSYPPGSDVQHERYGRGWVWGSGLGRVTVRFETAETPPGPVRTFPVTDPELGPVPRSAAPD